MCIRDRCPEAKPADENRIEQTMKQLATLLAKSDPDAQFAMSCLCLLYTSDAADDLLCVDLGGRRIIKKKQQTTQGIEINYNQG